MLTQLPIAVSISYDLGPPYQADSLLGHDK